ncbi:MAG: hypothetical protein ACI9HK_005370 [Pirellulaceae bacterium]
MHSHTYLVGWPQNSSSREINSQKEMCRLNEEEAMRLSSELQVQLIRTMSYETLECRLAMTIDSIGDDLPIDQHSSPTLELHGSLESVVEAPSLVLHGIGR